MPINIDLTNFKIQLLVLRNHAENAGGNLGAWSEFYRYVAKVILKSAGADIDELNIIDSLTYSEDFTPIFNILFARHNLPAEQLNTAIWFLGAAQVNADKGIFSKMIREYNLIQGKLRSKNIDDSDLQIALNKVGSVIASKILDSEGDKIFAPTLDEIVKLSLGTMRDILYPNNDVPGSEMYLNPAASEIIFSGRLGENLATNLILPNDGNGQAAIDTLQDIENLLFAWTSFKKAFDSTKLSLAGAKDLAIALGIVNLSDIASLININNPKWWMDTMLGNQNANVHNALDLIANVGSENFLNMMMGAVEGKVLIGNSDNSDFVLKAAQFFAGFNSEQLQQSSFLIPGNTSSVIDLAHIDANVRVALGALSFVVMKANENAKEKFTLYDESTGNGKITEAWIADRSAMLGWLGKVYSQNDFSVSDKSFLVRDESKFGGNNWEFYDVASGLKVKVSGQGFTLLSTIINPTHFVSFGDEADNILVGSIRGDKIYGADGNDNLTGGADDDYLEGGDGDDTLEGGTQNDILIGGKGMDIYKFNKGDGFDIISDIDGEGRIKIGDNTLIGGTETVKGSGVWKSQDGKYTFILTDNHAYSKAGELI